MMNECLNCGSPIRVSIFKGGDWCSDLCRKALARETQEVAERLRTKCSYELVYTDEVGEIDVCVVHGNNSKYPPSRGEHRPCLTLEPW